MTNQEILQELVRNEGVSSDAKVAYAAGYLEGFVLGLMDRYPAIRKDVEDRIAQRKGN